MNRIKYFPAQSPISLLATRNMKFLNYHVSWYKKNSIIHHPNLLTAYNEDFSTPLQDYIDEDITIMGDSGGFQNITLGKNFDPNNVIKWENENCDIGMTLDIPPIDNLRSKENMTEEKFYKCMERSNINANIMMGKKSNELKLYLVIQGYDNKTRQDWLNDGRKEYKNWEGYSLSPKPQSDVLSLSDFLLFAKKNELKDIHILGVSGSNTLPIIVYMSKYFNSICLDSSSFTIGSRFRQYMLPYSMNKTMLLSGEKSNIIPNILPCDCPVCNIMNNAFCLNKTPDHAGWMINMHNLYNTQRYLTYLEGIVHDKELFSNVISEKVKDTIKYIDDQLEGKGQITF